MNAMIRHTKQPLLALVLASSLGLAACGRHEAPPPSVSEPSVVATLATAEAVELPATVEVQGTVEADKTATISSRVAAMVTRVAVVAGDPVRRGQLLLEIDPETAQGLLAQARGALAQAQAALALAARNHERFTALAKADAASDLEVDMAKMQFEQAQGAVEQARGAVQAASSVAAESRVVAPFAGRIVRKMVEVGDLAAPGRPLMILESGAGRRLTLAVPESVMAQAELAAGDELAVRLDTKPGLGMIAARVTERSPAADPLTHSFEVKAALPEFEVASGSTGRAQIPISTRRTISVPRTALHRMGGMTMVALRDQDGRAASRIVTVGRVLDDDRVEILSGLAGGETILVGLASLPITGARVEDPR